MIDIHKADSNISDPVFTSPKVRLLREKLWLKIKNWTISTTTDLILRKAIVADVLLFTMYELEIGRQIKFDTAEMLRFVPSQHHAQVLEQLVDDDISELFELDYDEIRVIANFQNLQNAMEYCGVFYEGFIQPVNPPVPRPDYDEPRSLLMEVIEAAMVVPPSRLKH